jgi:hypothetical protein
MGKNNAKKVQGKNKVQKNAPAVKSAQKPKTKQIAKVVKAPVKVVQKVVPKTQKKTAPSKATKPAKPVRKPIKASPKVVKAPAVNAAAPKAPKAAKVPKASGPKGYTPAEYEKYKELKKKFEDLSNQALKDLLRKNMQSMTGNKDELIAKCADGATLGQIPRCPSCFGGRYTSLN